MTNRTRTTVLLLALGLAGCDERSPVRPAPPPPLPVPSPSPSPGAPAALSVTAVAPKTGPAGALVIISGTGFLSGATVTLGSRATNVIVVNSTRILATAPVDSGGTVDVVATNPSGESARLTAGYTFEAVTLTATPTVVAPGGQLSVTWVAPNGRPGGDWVGLFRVADPSTSYENGWWKYTNDTSSGTLTLSAPAEPGQYEFRYLLDDGYIDVARAPVTVRAGS